MKKVVDCQPRVKEEGAKDQRGWLTCLSPHSWLAAMPSLRSRRIVAVYQSSSLPTWTVHRPQPSTLINTNSFTGPSDTQRLPAPLPGSLLGWRPSHVCSAFCVRRRCLQPPQGVCSPVPTSSVCCKTSVSSFEPDSQVRGPHWIRFHEPLWLSTELWGLCHFQGPTSGGHSWQAPGKKSPSPCLSPLPKHSPAVHLADTVTVQASVVLYLDGCCSHLPRLLLGHPLHTHTHSHSKTTHHPHMSPT